MICDILDDLYLSESAGSKAEPQSHLIQGTSVIYSTTSSSSNMEGLRAGEGEECSPGTDSGLGDCKPEAIRPESPSPQEPESPSSSQNSEQGEGFKRCMFYSSLSLSLSLMLLYKLLLLDTRGGLLKVVSLSFCSCDHCLLYLQARVEVERLGRDALGACSRMLRYTSLSVGMHYRNTSLPTRESSSPTCSD